MKKIISILLSIIFALLLFVTLLFNTIRTNVTPSKIMDLGANMLNSMAQAPVHNNGLFYPGQKIITTAGYEINGVEIDIDLNNLDIGQIAQQFAQASGYDIEIDEELIADILSDPEAKALVDDVMNQAVDYISGKSETLNLNPEKVESVVVKSIKKIEEKTGQKIEYDPQELKEGLATGISEALPAVTESLDEVKEENGAEIQTVLTILDLFTIKYLIILLIALVVIAALIFVTNMNIFATFRYISISALIIGIIYIIAGCLEGTILSKIIELIKYDYESLVAPITVLVSTIFKQLLLNGIFTTIPAVAIGIIGFIPKQKSE